MTDSKQNFNKFLTEAEIMNRMNYIQKLNIKEKDHSDEEEWLGTNNYGHIGKINYL